MQAGGRLGTLRMLGRRHPVAAAAVGITLDASSPSATASFALATQDGQWQTVPAARLVALDPGEPMYVPLPDQGAQARFAQLTVTSATGAPVCVGELRLFGPDRSAEGM